MGESSPSEEMQLVFSAAPANWAMLNMRPMVIPIVVGALGTVSKSLEKGLEEAEIRRRTDII